MKKNNKMVTGNENKVIQKKINIKTVQSLHKYFFPEEGISVEAENLQYAQEKIKKIHSKK